jgi:uncharacterized protein (TIGR02266 family)
MVLKVEYVSREGFLHDYSSNISRGGMMIRTRRPLAIGEPIDLLLSFPGLLRRIALRGEVRWIRQDELAGEQEVGVEFDEQRSESWRELALLVERIIAGDHSVVNEVTVRILVVEDNRHVADLIRRGIASHLHRNDDKVALELVHASEGHLAWQMLQAERFDLLITDIYLPGIDGQTLIGRLRADRRWDGMPIIAVSVAEAELRRAVLDAGADFFLSKPIWLEALLSTMRRLVITRDVERNTAID